jgi:hypothetical protein
VLPKTDGDVRTSGEDDPLTLPSAGQGGVATEVQPADREIGVPWRLRFHTPEPAAHGVKAQGRSPHS